MKTFTLLFLVFSYSFSPAQAQLLGIPSGADRSDNYITGWGFTAAVNAPGVDYVGYFINPNDTSLTLQSAHAVGLYTDSFGTLTLVEQGLVNAGATADSSSGSYAWAQLNTPITLTAGTTYVVLSSNGNGDYWNGNGASVTVADARYGTLANGGYDSSHNPFTTTLANTYTVVGPSYYGGNIADTISVPEPSPWAIMLGGFGILVIAIRHRRSENA